MNRPTLSQFRAQWPTEILGICAADPQVAAYANDACQRLLMDPTTPEEGWWGGWATMALSATVENNHAYVTTPREVARLTDLAVCQDPIHIRNGFYEYLKFGAGLYPKTCVGNACGGTFQAFERDSVPILGVLLTPAQTIRIYPTDARDSGLRVLLQGLDSNGQVVLSTSPSSGLSAPGEYIVLKFPFADSVYQYTKITGIQKDETYGPVQYFQINPTTSVEVALTSMEPSEGTASYRRYLVAGIPNKNLCCYAAGTPLKMTAQARLDFIPVQSETDYLIIQNIPALIEESISIKFSRIIGSEQKAAIHHVRALNLLNGELDVYTGKANTAVRVPIFGSNRMHRQPV